MNEVTRILTQLEQGDRAAAGQLLPLVYAQLRSLAAERLAREQPGQTLQPTALVHEAYLRLVGGEDAPRWDGRGHFYAAAAEAIRRILVDRARRKRRVKHGGDRKRVELQDPAALEDQRLLALDEALRDLAEEDPEAARVVELRRFGGLSHAETARYLGVSVSAARAKWNYARAWLAVALQEPEPPGPEKNSRKSNSRDGETRMEE